VLSFSALANEYYSPLLGGCATLLTSWYCLARDELMKYTFPTTVVSVAKKTFGGDVSTLFYVVKTEFFVVAAVYLLSFLNCINFTFTDTRSVLATILFDFAVITLGKDLTSMLFIHKWMHQKEHFHLHSVHHEITKTVDVFHAHRFDYLDLILENVIGIVWGITVNYLLFGTPSIHLFAYLWVVWGDVNLHSVNPYSILYFIPFLDQIFRSNISHNLHHALLTTNYTIIPYNHVMKKTRDADIQKYNKIYQTNIE